VYLGISAQLSTVAPLYPDFAAEGEIRRWQNQFVRFEDQEIGVAPDDAIKPFLHRLPQRTEPRQVAGDDGLRADFLQQRRLYQVEDFVADEAVQGRSQPNGSGLRCDWITRVALTG
jgi:hypothetical protein